MAIMSKMTFLELAERLLAEEKRPLSADEIWTAALNKGLDKEVRGSGKTPWNSIGAQIYVDLKNADSLFIKVGSRPRRFFLKRLPPPSENEMASVPTEPQVSTRPRLLYLEKDLHALLAYFAFTNLSAYCKTISHPRSGRKEYGEWVHPDVVGCYFPIDEWRPEVIEFSASIGSVAIKLFSFEVKRELNFGNLRESFFQAVSNSSWANESYLAASEISRDEDFLTELQRLSTSFGIGIISLDTSEPDSSSILYPSKSREYLDWDAINKLAMNLDFLGFLKRIKTDLGSKEVRQEMYDKILLPEDLVKVFSK